MEQKTINVNAVNGFDSWYKTFMVMMTYSYEAKDWYDTIAYYYQVGVGEAGLFEMALDYTNHFENEHNHGWKDEEERRRAIVAAMRDYESDFHS